MSPLLIIGPFPPPVHGLAVITQAVTEQARKTRFVKAINTAISESTPRPLYHLMRIGMCLYACLSILLWRVTGKKTVMIVLNDGFGLVYNIATFLTARLLAANILLHHHSFKYITQDNRMIRLITRFSGKSTKHVFLCPQMKEKFLAVYGPLDSAILENAAFVPDQSDMDARPSDHPFTIGMLSNLTAEKGLYEFLDLAKELSATDANVMFVLGGAAADPKDAKAIEDTVAKLGDSFVHLGRVFGPEKDQFFRDLDLFVFPTKYVTEAQPTVIFEAQSFGLPVISRPMGCVASQLGPYDTLIETTDTEFVQEASKDILARIGKTVPKQSETITDLFAKRKELALASMNSMFDGA